MYINIIDKNNIGALKMQNEFSAIQLLIFQYCDSFLFALSIVVAKGDNKKLFVTFCFYLHIRKVITIWGAMHNQYTNQMLKIRQRD